MVGVRIHQVQVVDGLNSSHRGRQVFSCVYVLGFDFQIQSCDKLFD
jgi:hypothetical protein